MFPENHLRFSCSYSHEFLKMYFLTSGIQPKLEKHSFFDFFKTSFITLFSSKMLAFSWVGLLKKLNQSPILKFLKHEILSVLTLETEFFQFNKLDKTEINNHINLTKNLC